MGGGTIYIRTHSDYICHAVRIVTGKNIRFLDPATVIAVCTNEYNTGESLRDTFNAACVYTAKRWRSNPRPHRPNPTRPVVETSTMAVKKKTKARVVSKQAKTHGRLRFRLRDIVHYSSSSI